MTDVRVIVTGSRDWPDPKAVWLALAEFANTLSQGTLTVVHGDCPTGADRAAARWCRLPVNGPRTVAVVEEPHPADWAQYGRAAGPIRNREMVDAGADLVLAFPLPGPKSLSKGTWDCIGAAEAHGIPVRVIEVTA